jgi:cytoskeletal protein RodZ
LISLRKYGKLLGFSTLSLMACFFVESSDKINSGLKMILESESPRALGVYILLILGKFFLLLFGVLGLLLFVYELLKRKKT